MYKIQISRWVQIRRQSVHINAQRNLLMKAEIQHLLQFTFQRLMHARCSYRNHSRMTRPNSERDFFISRRSMFRKRQTWGLHSESPRQDPKISEIETLQQSRKDPSNALCARKTRQGNQLGHCTRTCTQFQVRILRIDIDSSNQVPRALYLHLP